MENETFVKITMNYPIEENKKKKDIKKIKEDNASMKQMEDGVKTVHEEKLKLNEI